MHPYRATDLKRLIRYTPLCVVTKDVAECTQSSRCSCGMIMTPIANGRHCHGCGKTILNSEVKKDE
jgi:hypothetical protein